MNKLILIFICAPLICIGQKQGNIWYFGDHAGLDFNSGNPVALTNGQTYYTDLHSEGTSVICDSSGSLLFYTNGQKIWNMYQQVMPEGDGLLGHPSSTQAALIVPQPGSDNYFYLFTTDAFYEDNLKYGFRYSVVDMCLDNGSGDVVQDKKNIFLLDTVAEKLTAIRHSNNIDYWIITHKFYSDAFYAYLLTSSGIVDTTISNIGSVHKEYCTNSTSPTRSALGQLKASPDGNKIACVSGQTCYTISELFDFNRTSGIVSNAIQLHTDSIAAGLYGVSFSTDNSKLYISSWINHDRIYQYDLSSGNSTSIVNSKTIIADHLGGPWYMGMQLGPDGKIYVAIRNQTYLAVINNPDLAGSNCNFVDAAISLNGNSCSFGLPNFIDFYNYSNTGTNCAVVGQDENHFRKISLSPNPFNNQTNLQSDKNFNKATLILYNSLGQEVKQIKDIIGRSITIYRDNLPSGLYFLLLTQDREIIANEKLVITD